MRAFMAGMSDSQPSRPKRLSLAYLTSRNCSKSVASISRSRISRFCSGLMVYIG